MTVRGWTDGDEYMSQVRKLPCCAPPISVMCTAMDSEHRGPIQAHHAGRRPGTSMKAPDDTCIPLCAAHHRQWHDANGVFKGWAKADRRTWADAAISDVQGLVARIARRSA